MKSMIARPTNSTHPKTPRPKRMPPPLGSCGRLPFLRGLRSGRCSDISNFLRGMRARAHPVRRRAPLRYTRARARARYPLYAPDHHKVGRRAISTAKGGLVSFNSMPRRGIKIDNVFHRIGPGTGRLTLETDAPRKIKTARPRADPHARHS